MLGRGGKGKACLVRVEWENLGAAFDATDLVKQGDVCFWLKHRRPGRVVLPPKRFMFCINSQPQTLRISSRYSLLLFSGQSQKAPAISFCKAMFCGA